MTKICFVITDPMNLYSLFRDQFLYLEKNGFEVTAIASAGKEHELLRSIGIRTVIINMKRKPHLLFDLKSLFLLWLHFIFNRYDVVHVSTPKASLLGSISARLAWQRRIVYMVRGRAYENYTGFKYRFYSLIEKFICKLSNSVLMISREMMSSMLSDNVVKKEKVTMLLNGSSNGVDLTKFKATDALSFKAHQLRERLKLTKDDFVFLYSGRIRAEKGINELVEAFEIVREAYSCKLIIQGVYESLDPLKPEILETMNSHSDIIVEPWTTEVVPYYEISNVFVFPSYREGFGNVALEAAAMELPVVGFNVIGCRESIVDNLTGYLVETGNAKALASKMLYLMENSECRKKMGIEGRQRIKSEFDSKLVWEFLATYYKR